MFVFLLLMKHRGEIIEKAVRDSGISITEIARRLNKSRQWVYNLFENPIVSIEVASEIGKIIHYDFTLEIDPRSKDAHPIISSEDRKEYVKSGSADYWKTKYYTLLEEHMELLKRQSK